MSTTSLKARLVQTKPWHTLTWSRVHSVALKSKILFINQNQPPPKSCTMTTETKYKSTQNMQIPSMQGRAAEVTASINPLLESFFDASSFDDNEALLADILQAYISPDPDAVRSNEQIANTVHAVRAITNLLRKLEVLNNQMEGGSNNA